MAAGFVIVGASAFGRQIAEYVQDAGHTVEGFVDDNTAVDLPHGMPLLGTTEELQASESGRFLIAVAEPRTRKAIAARLAARGAQPGSFAHPTAFVSTTASIGAGTVICPFAHVGLEAQVGEHVLVNSYAFVGHHATLGPYSALMGFACVNGGGTLGEGVYVGTHASINPNRKIGEWAKVASGSIVYKDMGERVLITGNPAEALPLLELNRN